MKPSRMLIASAIASLAAGAAASARAHAPDAPASQEKCYGVAKAGHNDCANLSGSHSCAGQSKADHAVDDWKYVAKGTCAKLGGTSAEEAKKKLETAKK